ncbi:unnamed protein product, partial [Polarella glacialis]
DGTLHLWQLGDLLERRERWSRASAEADSYEDVGGGHHGDARASRSMPELPPNYGRHSNSTQLSPSPSMLLLEGAPTFEVGNERLVDLRPQKHNRHPVLDLHVQPRSDGVQLLASQEDGRACLYNLGRDRPSAGPALNFSISHKAVLSARFHPHFPSVFAASSQDQVVRIMDSREKNLCACVSYFKANTSVGCVRWRPDHEWQLATTASNMDMISGTSSMAAGLLVWDLRKPFLPLHQFNDGGSDPMPDFLWADTNHMV